MCCSRVWPLLVLLQSWPVASLKPTAVLHQLVAREELRNHSVISLNQKLDEGLGLEAASAKGLGETPAFEKSEEAPTAEAEAVATTAAKETATEVVVEVLRSLGIINSSDAVPAALRTEPSRNLSASKSLGRVIDHEWKAPSLDSHTDPMRGPSSGNTASSILHFPFAVLRGIAKGMMLIIEPLYEALHNFLYGTDEGPVFSDPYSKAPLKANVTRAKEESLMRPDDDALKGDMWSDKEKHSGPGHADLIGITAGALVLLYAFYSIQRYRREANRIISLFEANTQIKELEGMAAKGEALPSLVVIRGHINSDGGDIRPVSTSIEGLRERVGEIEQPKNAWIEIARQAKRDPQFRDVANAVVERTGVDADDVPDVPDPGDTYSRHSTFPGEGSLVLAEILVARICAKHQRRKPEKGSIVIKRPKRNESYNCFHGRRVSEGIHLIDLDGSRADLELPPADAVGLAGVPDPPPLFLPVSDVWTEFTHYLRKDGLTGPGGRQQNLHNLPPMRLSDPYTLLSEFIFVDVQSPGDLGGFSKNPAVLSALAEAYRSSQGPAKFLWEPRGFYDSVRGGGYDDVPTYASKRNQRTEMVNAGELLERAKVAAKENSKYTPHCEPTFSRTDLEQRRDEENCFRYTELAIPRGTPVTILAKPMIFEAGTGEGAECRVRLVSPLGAEDDSKDSADPKADRFRFRILKGHQVENLLRHKELNPVAYYALAALAIAFIIWASSGYPGMST
mmetsp:Transcript_87327/g.154799  ORF Transcript_87327/g.154799 Transcript_87327/m.154799 type:complete len:735 (-) Transcript_87327:31-2235(-)